MASKMEEINQFQASAASSVHYATMEAERMGREAQELAERKATEAAENATRATDSSAYEAQRKIQEATNAAISLLSVHQGAAEQMSTLKAKIQQIDAFEVCLEILKCLH